MTTNNFFENVSSRMKELASQGADRMRSALGGLRGAPATPEAPYQTGEAAAAKFGAEGSPEAQAYRASRAAQAPAAAEATGLRAGAARLGRTAGPAYAAVNEGSSLLSGLSDPGNQNVQGVMRTVGRSALRGGATILGGVGGALAGTLVAPGAGTAIGGVGGAYAGEKAGDFVADKLFGPEKTAPTAASAAQVSQPPAGLRAAPVAAQQPAQPDPEDIIAGRATPGEGYGAIKGGDRPAVSVGSGRGGISRDAAQAQANGAAAQAKNSYAGGLRATSEAKPQGVFGELAQASSLRAADVSAQRTQAQMNKNVEHGLTNQGQEFTREANISQRNLQIAQLGHTMGNENEKRVAERTADYVRAKMVPPSGVTLPGADKDFEGQVKQKTAQVNDLIKYSLSDRKDGRTVAQLPEAEHSQLMLANDLRERITDARGGLVQSMRDFFGTGRFESRNLYSYMPTKAEPAMNGGYKVHFANGNTANVTEVAGGKFVLTGPNTPVDSEVMAILKPVIDRARAGSK